MSNMRGHEHLYDSILSVADSLYKKVDYMNRNIIVTAEAEENTTVAPTEKPTELRLQQSLRKQLQRLK